LNFKSVPAEAWVWDRLCSFGLLKDLDIRHRPTRVQSAQTASSHKAVRITARISLSSVIDFVLCRETALQQTGLSQPLHIRDVCVGGAAPAQLVHTTEELRVCPECCKLLE